MILKTDFVLRRGIMVNRLLSAWKEDCPIGVLIGEKWFKLNKLQKAKEENKDFDFILKEIISDAKNSGYENYK
ncbi:MAG: hypothetical protein FH753_09095 [Firmicutes bacterium]|nr:hypothetical protein [Bacillota bacterium]